MGPEEHLAAVRREAEALAVVAGAADLGAAVPACPGWAVRNLVVHTGRVFAFWGRITAERITDPDQFPARAEPPEDADRAGLVVWYRERAAELVSALDGAPLDAEVWTWAEHRTAGFVRRRMACEAAIHRWDAQAALGAPEPVAADLAADGTDEFLVYSFARRVADGAEPLGGSVHLHATDVAGEWIVRSDGDDYRVEEGHEKGDAALRGTASDLFLACWRRQPIDALEVIGDRGVAERFLALSSL